MNALVRAEVRKLAATRSSLLMVAAAAVYPVLTIVAVTLMPEDPTLDSSTLLEVVRGTADVVTLVVLGLGLLAMAGEHRHGTIVPTLLVSPRRGRVVAAKLAALAMVGAAVSVGVSAVAVAAGSLYLRSEGVSVDVVSGDVLVTVAGAAVVAALYAALGTAVGAVVRNQTAAVAGALVWVLTVENVLPVVLRNPDLKRWLPGGAADRLLQMADGGAAWGALGLLVAVAGALALAALAVTRTADVH